MSWNITGAGAIASVGRGVDELFTNLCLGRTGLHPLRGFDPAPYRAKSAYEIDNRPAPGVDAPHRATDILVAAIREAAADAGVDDLTDVPILVGTGLRELRSLELWWRDGVPFSADDLHFGTALREQLGAEVTYTFSNACAASLYALAMGTDLLALDAADTIVVAGVDVLTESMHGLLERVHAVPPDRVRPFDRNRTGVLMGDGAAAIVVQRDTAGKAPRGLLRAVSANCDAYHVTAPDPQGIATAMRAAHELAGVKPEDIDLVMLHGTGTLLNDEVEATAMGEVYGEHVGGPLMTAIKSMTGHTSGASGLMGLVMGLESLRCGVVPPTVGLTDPVDEAARFRFVRGEAESAELAVAQLNAFGFGGINAVAIVEAVQ
ncbi:beta-ketoacyl-[acyl-carrier-protein] synthase family protein [Actinokineospora soli]|uniref:Beta-ketoacyl-[acyl-carrier-protein] synthase family protein n=1 Tax=Actinokineospora soli TaxID=1048753 RepID=A0ABW2TY80_9PSEU